MACRPDLPLRWARGALSPRPMPAIGKMRVNDELKATAKQHVISQFPGTVRGTRANTASSPVRSYPRVVYTRGLRRPGADARGPTCCRSRKEPTLPTSTVFPYSVRSAHHCAQNHYGQLDFLKHATICPRVPRPISLWARVSTKGRHNFAPISNWAADGQVQYNGLTNLGKEEPASKQANESLIITMDRGIDNIGTRTAVVPN